MRILTVLLALALIVPSLARAEFQGSLGIGTFQACESNLNRVEQQENLIALFGAAGNSVVLSGLHSLATQGAYANYQVPSGKQLRIFCIVVQNQAAQTVTVAIGYGDDASTVSDSADPTNAVYFTSNGTFDDIVTPASIGTTSIPHNGVVPAQKYPFARYDNGASDVAAVYVYGLLEDI